MASGIEGMADLKRAFHDLATMAERNQEIALKIVANQYKTDVQRIAPYDTGTLRRSIHVEMINSGSAIVGTDLPYARRLEYGFSDRDKRGRMYHQPARPYFRPPLDENWQKYQRMYLEAMNRV